ncbi:MAG: carbohydrate ABC transporter permease, partial [Micrococcaceae bacterium]|nr:carbohydrate ABC transporter permease [Micrococcaceae bacterium]
MSENLDVAVVTPIRRKRNRAASPAMAGERTFLRGLGITVLWIAVAVMILMLVWMVAQSFRGTREILSDPWGIPASMDFTNYVNAWTVGNFAQATWNSFMTTVVSSVVAVAVAAPAAYYLGRVENKLTNALSLYFILGLGIPAQVILIPLFVMLNKVYLT